MSSGEGGRKFLWPRAEARAGEQCQSDCKEGAFLRAVEGPGRVYQLSARMTVPGPGRVSASDGVCVCLWPIAGAKA